MKMIRRIQEQIIILATILFATSCASSLTPAEVNKTLPTMTKSQYYSPMQAEEKVKNDVCKYLVRNRTYVAPLGTTAKNDLKLGAKGIDEWVKLDGGNAYVLRNYKWIRVDQSGSTQLTIEFDTMLCK